MTTGGQRRCSATNNREMSDAVTLIAVLLGPVSGLLGLFAGAWLVYRARNGQSPMPAIGRRIVVTGGDSDDDGV